MYTNTLIQKNMKKVLVVTFFWPPSGKATLHWPLKVVKFLPEFKWQPVVLTVKEDTFSAKDESLMSEVSPSLEVIKTGYFDPFILYRKLLGKDPDKPLIASETISKTNKSFLHRLSIWIRMNLFVPDARAGWYRQAVKHASQYLSTNPVDAVITVGPPHSSHLIGMRLSKKFNIPHIPVLIDPWVDIVYYKDFKRNPLVLKLDRYFEETVMKRSAAIVFVTENTRNDFIRKYPGIKDKTHVFYWGYNEEDFSNIHHEITDKEILLHAGNIFDYQNTPNLWKTVKEEINNGRNLFIKFIGTVSPAVKQSITQNGLADRTTYSGFIPYHAVVKEMCSASYLLVCATEPRHVPGKLFEYLRTGKPVLAFGEDNDEVKRILEKNNAGMLFRYNDSAKEFFLKSKEFTTNIDSVKQYDRRSIARGISEILDSL